MNTDDHTKQHHRFTSRVLLGKPVIPGMAMWLVKKAVIKNLAQAKKIIVGLVILDFLFAALILYFFVIR